MPGPALATGAVWLLVAASAVHWTLRLGVHGTAVPAQSQTVTGAQALQGDALRLFARSEPVVAAVASSPARDRFKVFGVAAREGDGWVLMSVDGKPARAFRRGAPVDGQWQVLSVAQRRIEIGPPQGPAAVALDLPSLPPAATGQRPPAQSFQPSPPMSSMSEGAPPLAVPPEAATSPDATAAR